MTILYLGNVVDGEKRRTEVILPDTLSLAEQFRVITDSDGVWVKHSADVDAPTWVATDSEGLNLLLSEHFGVTDIRVPIHEGEHGEFPVNPDNINDLVNGGDSN